METERLRSAQLQGEKTLEARERAHRQRVKGLEEQVSRTMRKKCLGNIGIIDISVEISRINQYFLVGL